jgi:alpha-amylase
MIEVERLRMAVMMQALYCDTPNYDLRKLTDGESVSAGRPFNAVTFTDNHDISGDEVVNDKMLGYSFILTGDGYPCIFWWDYFNCELARPRTPNGIDALIDAHHRYAGGKASVLHADPDLYIMQRHGTAGTERLGLCAEQSRESMEWHFGEDEVDKSEV